MIDRFVARFMERKESIAQELCESATDYASVVKIVVKGISEHRNGYAEPDWDRITEVSYGDYQGTLVYVIGCKGYQPDTHWTMEVDYGSCSSCDTLQDIQSMPVGGKQKEDFATLALHLVQSMKEI